MNTPYHKIFPNYNHLTVQHNKVKCKIKEEKKQLRLNKKQCKLKDAVAENAQEENESAEAAHPIAATEPRSHPAELLNQYKYPQSAAMQKQPTNLKSDAQEHQSKQKATQKE